MRVRLPPPRPIFFHWCREHSRCGDAPSLYRFVTSSLKSLQRFSVYIPSALPRLNCCIALSVSLSRQYHAVFTTSISALSTVAPLQGETAGEPYGIPSGCRKSTDRISNPSNPANPQGPANPSNAANPSNHANPPNLRPFCRSKTEHRQRPPLDQSQRLAPDRRVKLGPRLRRRPEARPPRQRQNRQRSQAPTAGPCPGVTVMPAPHDRSPFRPDVLVATPPAGSRRQRRGRCATRR